MLIVMEKKAKPHQIDAVVKAVENRGYTARPIPGGERVSIGILYNKGPVDPALFLGLPGVQDAVPITRPYKLVSREFKPEDTLVKIGGVTVGNGHMTIIAGPCSEAAPSFPQPGNGHSSTFSLFPSTRWA